MNALSRILAGAALASLTVGAALADASLKVGSAAPPLAVAKWIKGKPIKNFEKGKVYVVEFWATWCGPCKQSIPHLTELAKKFQGKATFTGVSVWEEQGLTSNTHLPKVEQFVKDWAGKMEYNVAADGYEGTMAKTWMAAAGQNGIPTAFVIDKTGTVVWIGHPMGDLDKVVAQVVDGTFDANAEAARQEAARIEGEKRMAPIKEFMTLMQQGKFDEAVASMDKAFAADPMIEMSYGIQKFTALSLSGGDANSYGRKLLDLYKNNPNMLNSLAWSMVDDKSKLKNPDYKLAIEIAERGVEVSKADDPMLAYVVDTLAYAYFKDGQLDKAIQHQEKALKLADSTKDFDPEVRKEIADRLEMFKKKKG